MGEKNAPPPGEEKRAAVLSYVNAVVDGHLTDLEVRVTDPRHAAFDFLLIFQFAIVFPCFDPDAPPGNCFTWVLA